MLVSLTTFGQTKFHSVKWCDKHPAECLALGGKLSPKEPVLQKETEIISNKKDIGAGSCLIMAANLHFTSVAIGIVGGIVGSGVILVAPIAGIVVISATSLGSGIIGLCAWDKIKKAGLLLK